MYVVVVNLVNQRVAFYALYHVAAAAVVVALMLAGVAVVLIFAAASYTMSLVFFTLTSLSPFSLHSPFSLLFLSLPSPLSLSPSYYTFNVVHNPFSSLSRIHHNFSPFFSKKEEFDLHEIIFFLA